MMIMMMIMMMMIHAIESKNLIISSCKKFASEDPNINNNICTTSLQAARGNQGAGLKGLGSILIRLVRRNITDTHCYIKQVLKKGKWDTYVKQCLSVCLELYSDAKSSVKVAKKNYRGKRYDEANLEMSAILDAPVTCEDGVKERITGVSPLSKRTEDTLQLSAITLSIIHLIQIGRDNDP